MPADPLELLDVGFAELSKERMRTVVGVPVFVPAPDGADDGDDDGVAVAEAEDGAETPPPDVPDPLVGLVPPAVGPLPTRLEADVPAPRREPPVGAEPPGFSPPPVADPVDPALAPRRNIPVAV